MHASLYGKSWTRILFRLVHCGTKKPPVAPLGFHCHDATSGMAILFEGEVSCINPAAPNVR